VKGSGWGIGPEKDHMLNSATEGRGSLVLTEGSRPPPISTIIGSDLAGGDPTACRQIGESVTKRQLGFVNATAFIWPIVVPARR
jgi:hypothetical protein